MAKQALSTNTFTVAKWVVDPDPTQGTHTTIQGATNDASSGDTIFVRPGTYTENITIKAGVVYTTLSDAFPTGENVIVIGKWSFTGGGNANIKGFLLETNGDYVISFTGTTYGTINFYDCSIVGTNHQPILATNTGTSSGNPSVLNLYTCELTTGLAATALFTASDCSIGMYNSELINDGTTNTATNSLINVAFSNLFSTFTAAGTGRLVTYYTGLNNQSTATPLITSTGSGTSYFVHCQVEAGSATSASIGPGTGLYVVHTTIASSAASTFVISGTGSVAYGYLLASGTATSFDPGLTLTHYTEL